MFKEVYHECYKKLSPSVRNIRIFQSGIADKHGRNKKKILKIGTIASKAVPNLFKTPTSTSRNVRVPVITTSEFPVEFILQYFSWKSFTPVCGEMKEKR